MVLPCRQVDEITTSALPPATLSFRTRMHAGSRSPYRSHLRIGASTPSMSRKITRRVTLRPVTSCSACSIAHAHLLMAPRREQRCADWSRPRASWIMTRRRHPSSSRAERTRMRATDTVEIGRTGLHVTRLGLGGVALSGAAPPPEPHAPSPEAEAVSLIRRSLDLGLNYLDTAPMYGVGHSERRYGQALTGIPRDRYVLY